MPAVLNVYALPRYADPRQLAGGTAVVIDVLRATTTIVYALQAGATEIIPCGTVEETAARAGQFPREKIVLGGERGGRPLPGFDLGNSPEEYTADRVAGKTILFTTTNGTQALLHAQPAARILPAAFVNASAVLQRLLDEEQIHILCAGTDGQFSEDDILLAGLLVSRLENSGKQYVLNAQAQTARENWLHAFALPYALGAEPLPAEHLARELRKSRGAQNLLPLGYAADILAAALLDKFACVPEADPATLRIHLPQTENN
ncbi:MAG: 2-phosphosulfolactate phosphatase [Pirellulales bacterium]|nr:2-phosphosulfolactate phosphatase [Pirellulales bacterium]